MTTTDNPSLKEAYKRYLLENGKKPVSIYAFAKAQGISEADFYAHFNSFEAIDRAIWLDFLQHTLNTLQQDENYQGYTVREKMLSFYYSLIQTLIKDRSYVLMTWKQPQAQSYGFLKDFANGFEEYAQELVQEGVSTREIVNRPLLTEQYARTTRNQLFFVVDFWVKDQSKNFEQTDAAIEKAVNTAFDLAGRNALDSVADFGKFLFQHLKNN
jgi:AcrR family transcriptional regulator